MSTTPPATASMTAPQRSLSSWWLNVFNGGLLIAVADGIFFSTFWGLRSVSPVRILQGIASGLLGKASFARGAATAWLGAGLHLFIATMFVLVYALVGRRVAVLLRRPNLFGPPYGLLVYLLMSYAVVPLSRIGPPKRPEDPAWMIGSILFHIVVVGLASAWFARRAWGGGSAKL